MVDRPHLTINRRHWRAQQLLAHVIHGIQKYLPSDGRDERRVEESICRELGELFHVTGAYIVTDADRAAAGLPMRGVDGLTLDELKIIEAKMIEAMLAPRPLIMAGLDMADLEKIDSSPGHVTWQEQRQHIKITRPGVYKVTRDGPILVCETISDGEVVNRPPPPGS